MHLIAAQNVQLKNFKGAIEWHERAINYARQKLAGDHPIVQQLNRSKNAAVKRQRQEKCRKKVESSEEQISAEQFAKIMSGIKVKPEAKAVMEAYGAKNSYHSKDASPYAKEQSPRYRAAYPKAYGPLPPGIRAPSSPKKARSPKKKTLGVTKPQDAMPVFLISGKCTSIMREKYLMCHIADIEEMYDIIYSPRGVKPTKPSSPSRRSKRVHSSHGAIRSMLAPGNKPGRILKLSCLESNSGCSEAILSDSAPLAKENGISNDVEEEAGRARHPTGYCF